MSINNGKLKVRILIKWEQYNLAFSLFFGIKVSQVLKNFKWEREIYLNF